MIYVKPPLLSHQYIPVLFLNLITPQSIKAICKILSAAQLFERKLELIF
jgi:hypothetical protein